MDRHAIALVLEEIGTLLDLHGENRFKARAFHNAARAVERTDDDVAALARTGGLEGVSGVGPATAAVIRELVATGRSGYLAELRTRTPAGFRELLSVPGLGVSKVRLLHQQLGIQTVEELERAAAEGRIAEVRGFGERMQEKIAKGVQFVRGGSGRRRLARALESAERVIGHVRSLPGVGRAEMGGELRRCCETVAGVDLVARVEARHTPAVLERFAALPGAARGSVAGDDRAEAVLADGLALRLHCVPPAAFAAAWVENTGSQEHVEGLRAAAELAGLRLDGAGLWRARRRAATPDEASLYEALSLAWVPPELRETGRDEILAAAERRLPDLVRYEQLRGCFHCHTTASDGRDTLEQLAEGALARGWRYLGIADHSQAAGYAGGLSADEIARQHEAIDAWNDARGTELWLFKGIEADILADGSLDYAALGDAVLGRFDYVVGSVHSGFGMPRAQMTQRVLRALENPFLTFLGHPTGRLLLIREGYAIDLDAVIAAAAERDIGIEINADPHRMEMDWRYWKDARARGVLTAINPDAHSVRELDNVRLGTTVARKGWLEAADVVNAWDLDEVRKHFARKRS
jgi:DNA polymerase (family 10)